MIKPLVDNTTIAQLRQLVEQSKRIVITCHLSPDGDAIGSTLALCSVLCNMGKDAHVIVPDFVPRALHFVPGLSQVVTYSQQGERGRMLVRESDLIFCLDFNTLHRLDKFGEVIANSGKPKVLIDHHLSPDDNFDVKISFPHMASTCDLLYRVLDQLGYTQYLTREAAQCIYVGMMTDTGNFTYGSDYPELFLVLAELSKYNIDRQRLYNLALNTFTESSLRIQGYALCEKMQLFPQHGAALITLTREELQYYDYHKGDTEGLVNKPLTIPGVYWVMFLREDADQIKVSCRSQGDFSVSDICSHYFGGGGHRNAAGGEFHGTMDEAVALCMKILEEVQSFSYR